jgi:DNA-binding CsgD family transcriptional regulator
VGTKANLRAQIRNMCLLGLPGEVVLPRLFPLIRELVPADSAGFFWVDSSGHMENLVAERMLPAPKMRLYFERYYEGGSFDFQEGFQKRAAAGTSVAVSQDSEAFRMSAYYTEILRDLDAHYVLYGIVRAEGQALGQLSLYRSRRLLPFLRGEQTTLSSIMPLLTHAIASPGMLPEGGAQYVDSADDAVLMVTPNGHVTGGSELGHRLAVQAASGRFAREFQGVDAPAVRAVLAESVARVDLDEDPVLARDTRWGRIQLRAYRVGKPGDAHAVRITRQEPIILHFARSLQTLEIPPQQQEVAIHLARGWSNQEIAVAMSISVHTVSYHIKRLFRHLRAHGRAELIERVVGPHD